MNRICIKQQFPFQGPPKFTQIGIFALKRNHVATPKITESISSVVCINERDTFYISAHMQLPHVRTCLFKRQDLGALNGHSALHGQGCSENKPFQMQNSRQTNRDSLSGSC
jgi:hypothetical protein